MEKSSSETSNVTYISEYLERKATEIVPMELRKRLADIAIEKMLLTGEEIRLKKVLDEL